MATLKYKNGDTWTELSFNSGPDLDFYPIGSIYIGYGMLGKITTSSQPGNTSAQLNSLTIEKSTIDSVISPASFLGGTWNMITNGNGAKAFPSLSYINAQSSYSSAYAQVVTSPVFSFGNSNTIGTLNGGSIQNMNNNNNYTVITSNNSSNFKYNGGAYDGLVLIVWGRVA